MASSPEPNLPEHIGDFSIHGVLGRGGMGVVFDASTRRGERVALKIIRSLGEEERSSTSVARFLREARILQQVSHPGVVRLVDSGDMDGVLFLAMERIEGVSLLAIRRRGPLGLEALVQLGVRLADALAHLHGAGVVHRDIKPANVLITTEGRPVITDFGISGMSEATGITRQGDLLGSPGFMAPEVVNGHPHSPASDQYALGRLLFELGARGPAQRLPKKAPIFEILRIAMEVDWARFPTEGRWPELAAVVKRMLSNRPEDRFEGARAVWSALQPLVGDVLDTDTLSEHVDQLALPSATSWEALALDLAMEGHAPDPAEALLADLELPVGLQPRPPGPDATVEAPHPAPWAAPEPALPALPHGADDFDLSEPESPAPDDELVPPPRSSSATVELPTHALLTAPPPLLARTPPPGRDPTPVLNPLPPLPSLPVAAPRDQPTEGVPLTRLLERASGEEARPTPEASQVDRLERQLARAREDLERARRAVDEARKRPVLPWVLAIVAAGVVGTVAGTFLPAAPPPPPMTLVVVGSNPAALVAPRFVYGDRDPPTPQAVEDARGLLAQAQDHLAHQDIEAAKRLLGLCIQVADLPDCHKTLGSLLTLLQDPSGRAHLLRYVQTAGDAPDVEQVRRFLGAE
ncbi:MAG: serine/threonine protein kinase [Deltaproteobacteria bacterium]|nr:serine/threonine protein kinase [Deltaproteobacteria bacterium]